MTDPQPIMMRCPGSGFTTPHGLCPYCGCVKEVAAGAYISWAPDEVIPDHDTEDVLAMLDRGDFG